MWRMTWSAISARSYRFPSVWAELESGVGQGRLEKGRQREVAAGIRDAWQEGH